MLWVGSTPGYGAYDREDDAVRAALKKAEVVQSSELAARITSPYPANFGLQFDPGPDQLAIARFDRGNQPVYLLVNRTEQSIAARISAPIIRNARVFDPTTGSVTEIALPSSLELGPFRSLLILPD